jgi:hypothetical protein
MANEPKPWQEFEQLKMADAEAAATFCAWWKLAYFRRGRWHFYTTKAKGKGWLAQTELRRDHAKFVQAVTLHRRYAAALGGKDMPKAARLAQTLTRTLERGARYFFAGTIPLPRVYAKDELRVFRLKFVPSIGPGNFMPLGELWYGMMLDFTTGPVMRCASCGILFVGNERQWARATHKPNPFHVNCDACKATKSEYELRGERRKIQVREAMRRHRARKERERPR